MSGSRCSWRCKARHMHGALGRTFRDIFPWTTYFPVAIGKAHQEALVFQSTPFTIQFHLRCTGTWCHNTHPSRCQLKHMNVTGGQWFMNGGLRDVQVFMAGTCQICDKWQPNRWRLKKQIWFVLKRVYWGPCQQRHQRHVSCPILDLEAQWCRNWSAPRKTHK